MLILEAADPERAIRSPGSEPLVEVATGADRHVVIAHGTARLRLCVRHVPGRIGPSAGHPAIRMCGLRLAAAARLERATRGGSVATC